MAEKRKKVFRILLLTNRDSDNVGDQVIEACDISLLGAVMRNLGLEEDEYEIVSRAASIVTQKYVETKNPELLKSVRKQIKKCDLLIFGGAPLFNYQRQIFYERTAVTLEIAQEFGKPVLFSAIGVESYDEDDERCQRLKRALNLSCVRQITTRDHLDLLEKYRADGTMKLGKVADPAVFSSSVFQNLLEQKEEERAGKKKVGIFVLRAYGFTDNQITFTKADMVRLWRGTAQRLEEKGYDCEFLTSGHFGDEAFLDYLVRNEGFDEKKCVFSINSPEDLFARMASFDAVVSCRLHPGIISFALGIPAVGLVWNRKVTGFYDSIGYPDRAMSVADITPELLVEKLEQVMRDGVRREESYLMSVYETLFSGIRDALFPEKGSVLPYEYRELLKNLPLYPGITPEERQERIQKKFRRTYRNYNNLQAKNETDRETIRVLREESEKKHPLFYLVLRKGKELLRTKQGAWKI